MFKEPDTVPFPRLTPRGRDFPAARMRSGPPGRPTLYVIAAQAGRARASLASSSSLWFGVSFRWRDSGRRTREKLPPVYPPHPVSPPPSPASLSAPTARTGAVARLLLEEVGGRRPRAPGGSKSCSPRGTLQMGRSVFESGGVGESTRWGKGGTRVWGRDAAGTHAVVGRGALHPSCIWARAKCGLRLALGYRCSLPWRPVESPEPVCDWLGCKRSLLQAQFSGRGWGWPLEVCRSPPEGSQAEKILAITGTAMGCHLAPSVGRVRCCLSRSGVSLSNSDFQPAE